MNIKRYLCLRVVLFLILVNNVNSQSQWYWVEPRPSGNMLYSVHFTSVNTGYAAGALGTIIKTTDGGMSWDRLYSRVTEDLYSINFINDDQGVCAGKNGIIIFTSDGGTNWKPAPAYVNVNLHDVCFTDHSTGYIAGLSGTVLKTTDAGRSWKNLNTGLAGVSFFCSDFINSNTGVLGGYNIFAKTTNGGVNFTLIEGAVHPSTAVTGISYGDKNVVFAAGNSVHGTFYRSTNGGINWTTSTLNLPYLWDGTVDLVRSMNFLNNKTGYITTDFGTILRTTNSGASWKKDTSNRPSYEKLSVLYDLQMVSAERIYSCGNGGTMISSTDSGTSWNTLTGNRMSLYAAVFTDDETGYCAGEKGQMMKTVDGGTNWKIINSLSGKTLRSLCFTDKKLGYAAGDRGAIFKTEDEGSSWKDQTHYTNLDYKSITFIDEHTGIAGGGNPENERAFIYKTTNGGTNWYEVYDSLSMGVIRAAEFLSDTKIIACGDNGNILLSFDQGETWYSENLTNENLNTVSFKDDDNGIAAGTNGMTFKTTDGGVTWLKKHSGSFNTITGISYIIDRYYVIGSSGLIATSKDEGNSWQRHEVVTGSRLNSISSTQNSVLAFGEYGTILRTDLDGNLPVAGNLITHSPETFVLHQNYPNPFNPSTKIKLELSSEQMFSDVRLVVFDITGKEISVLYDGNAGAGVREFEFNAKELSGGIYFCSLFLDDRINSVKRMVYLK